ncbi:hypothetical protein KBD87_00070 [Candidatus Saccharibacteria bacterium]|nr:hypothetical protein [Candidatus Saccharibacteria bacterium]
MIDERWIYLSVILLLVGNLSYAYGVVRGTVRPNRMTWGILSIAPMIAAASMASQHVPFHQSLFTMIVGIDPLIIFTCSFFSQTAAWKLKRFDMLCGALAVGGLVAWQASGNANIAIAFSVFADGMAFLPTLIKAYKYPETEGLTLYVLGAISAVTALLIIDVWDFTHLAFPVYILTADVCAMLFVVRRYLHAPTPV